MAHTQSSNTLSQYLGSGTNTNRSGRTYKKVHLSDETLRILGNEFYYKDTNLCMDPSGCNHENRGTKGCTRRDCRFCGSIRSNVSLNHNHFRTMCCKNFNEDNSCQTTNVVYLIQCQCGLEYVGITTRKARERWMEHICKMKKWASNDSNKQDQKLYSHFNPKINKTCKLENIRFTILEKVQRDPIKENNTRNLKKREEFYLRLRNTAFPLGFNVDVTSYGSCLTQASHSSDRPHPYYNFRTKRRPRARGNQQSKNNNNNVDTLINNPIQNRVKLSKLLKITDKALMYQSICNNEDHRKIPKTARKPILKFPFIHKFMETSPICRWMKSTWQNVTKEKVTFTYCYDKTIGDLVFNYNDISRKSTQSEILKMANETKCCENINDSYKILNHVCTMNPSLLGHDLKKILLRGAKYRLNTNNKTVLKYKFKKLFISANANKLQKLETNKRNEVTSNILAKFNNFIDAEHIDNYTTDPEINPNLIKNLKTRYVFAPLDKCPSNISIICKNLYARLLAESLGYDTTKDILTHCIKTTYTDTSLTENEIHERQKEIYKYLNLETPDPKDTRMGNLYLTIKAHKFPSPPQPILSIKTRPITSATKSFTRDADTVLKEIFTHVSRHFINKTRYNEKYNGIRNFKSPEIKSTNEICQFLKKTATEIEETKNLKVHSYDVAGMFTSLRHDTIIKAMDWLLDQCMTDNRECVTIKNGRTQYCRSTESIIKWDKTQIMGALTKFLTENYLQFAGMHLLCTAGSPMGASVSPVICSTTLSVQEYKYFKIHPKVIQIPIKRYVDDICCLSTTEEQLNFAELSKNIYSDEIVLESDPKENGKTINFLDITIYITDKDIKYQNFDKRDMFNFKAIKLTHNDSNTPTGLKTSIIYSEFLRLLRRNSDWPTCLNSLKALKLACKQNNIPFDAKRMVYKIQRRQASDILKFRITPDDVINQITQTHT